MLNAAVEYSDFLYTLHWRQQVIKQNPSACTMSLHPCSMMVKSTQLYCILCEPTQSMQVQCTRKEIQNFISVVILSF